METIFDVGWWRRLIVPLLVPICSAMGAGMAWVGWVMLQPGSWEGEDALHGPHWLGILFGLAFVLGGLAFAIAAWFYGPAYVTRIDADREQGVVRVGVAGWVRGWSFTVRPEDIVSARWHEGYFDNGRMTVNAPWTTVRIRGRRLPLILDDQAAFAEWGTIDRLLKQQTLEPDSRFAQTYPKKPQALAADPMRQPKRSKKKRRKG